MFFFAFSIFADAFFVAFRLPNTFRRLFSEGSFNAAFIPSYVSEKSISQKKGKKFMVSKRENEGKEKI